MYINMIQFIFCIDEDSDDDDDEGTFLFASSTIEFTSDM